MTLSNYETAVKEEAKKVTRCFQRYTPEDRAARQNHRLGHRQRLQVGEHYYTHPAIPDIAFPTRKAAAIAAIELADKPTR